MAQGAFILGCAGARLTTGEKAFFQQADPWGFILFARNVETPDQLRQLTDDLRTAVNRDAPILIDQEGGRVQRMAAPNWRQWLPPLDHAATATDPERAMWLRYRLIAQELRDVGIDVNCAPIADVATADTHPFLRNRCYGEDPQTVARLSRAVAEGLMAGGVAPVVKHMPGHGRATADSHKDLPTVRESREVLQEIDFRPFQMLADIPMAMTAHIVFQAYDDRPATVSATMINLIRDQIGFAGLLMTDDISMQALDGTLTQRCHSAITAGCDLVLHCNGDLNEMDVVADSAGMLSDPASHRAHAALTARNGATAIDIKAAEAELRTLMSGKVYG